MKVYVGIWSGKRKSWKNFGSDKRIYYYYQNSIKFQDYLPPTANDVKWNVLLNIINSIILHYRPLVSSVQIKWPGHVQNMSH